MFKTTEILQEDGRAVSSDKPASTKWAVQSLEGKESGRSLGPRNDLKGKLAPEKLKKWNTTQKKRKATCTFFSGFWPVVWERKVQWQSPSESEQLQRPPEKTYQRKEQRTLRSRPPGEWLQSKQWHVPWRVCLVTCHFREGPTKSGSCRRLHLRDHRVKYYCDWVRGNHGTHLWSRICG